MNYNDKKFRAVQNSSNGVVSIEMIFEYKQVGNIVTCVYKGKLISSGHLIGTVDEVGVITMVYHQISKNGEIMTGVCNSKPEVLKNGKIRLHENWQWTSGDKSKGTSILEEI